MAGYPPVVTPEGQKITGIQYLFVAMSLANRDLFVYKGVQLGEYYGNASSRWHVHSKDN